MKIFGDESSTEFTLLSEEPCFFFGKHHVLKGSKKEVKVLSSCTKNSGQLKTIEPKLYLHIPTNAWTTFTGKLREYLLPWRWKIAYLDQTDNALKSNNLPIKILVYTFVSNESLSERLTNILGQSLFIASLIEKDCYQKICSQEFLTNNLFISKEITITHPFGETFGSYSGKSNYSYYHIYRSQNIFSSIRYYLLKNFSSSWKEVSLKVGEISETLLIQKKDEVDIKSLKLLA